jgi:molybdate transport system substrate-binding protein
VPTRRRRWFLAVLLALGFVGAACGSDEASEGDGDVTTGGTLTGELRVSAASSLTDAFAELGEQFEAMHPDLDVVFSFAASSALAEQVIQGAPADIVATADEASMARITGTGSAADPTTIARNRLAVVVGKGNPKGISGLADLGKRGVVFVVCAPEVPCGKFAAAALTKAHVSATPASLEENVKAVVSRVTLDEADAGIVYATDVQAAADEAEGVDIDVADDPTLEAVYPIATTTQASNTEAADAWIEFVLSDEGQAILATYGFLAP